MEHLELYKKYRPQNWDDFIGQAKVISSLKAAVKQNKIPTSYLFAGPRGCGKTSVAFVLAKAINCENPENYGPCNKCNTCLSIDDKSQPGVYYISMAQYGKVDDARELIQKARLAQPVKKQVWILDECHRMTKEAFDALLIPLEENNMPSLFIFCTTEVNKVPQTVLSRVQQRKFNLVEHDILKPFLENIVRKEGLDIADSTIESVIRKARGSVRDSLTALEEVIETDVENESFGDRILEALSEKDVANIMSVIADANADGGGAFLNELAEQLFEDLRNLLIYAYGVKSEGVLGQLPVADPNTVVKNLYGKRGLVLVMNEIGDGIIQMNQGVDSRIRLEIACVKAVGQLEKLKKAIDSRRNA